MNLELFVKIAFRAIITLSKLDFFTRIIVIYLYGVIYTLTKDKFFKAFLLLLVTS